MSDQQVIESTAEERAKNGRLSDGRFAKGNKGGGMKAMDPDIKAMLVEATPDRIRRLEKLSRDAEDKGDLKTASYIEIALLKKVVPDTTTLLVGGNGDAPIEVSLVGKMTPKRMQRVAKVLEAAGVLSEKEKSQEGE